MLLRHLLKPPFGHERRQFLRAKEQTLMARQAVPVHRLIQEPPNRRAFYDIRHRHFSAGSQHVKRFVKHLTLVFDMVQAGKTSDASGIAVSEPSI